ncbi:MAG: hypothetical protein ACLGSD_02490 [Acidobacteriota bacterium]
MPLRALRPADLLRGAFCALAVLCPPVVQAQAPGFDGLIRDQAPWPNPEIVANDLQSANAQTRLHALGEMGFTGEHAFEAIWSQIQTPARLVAKRALIPDAVRLTWAALGTSDERAALLAVYFSRTQTVSLSVVLPENERWVRVARFDCWCKYERGDVLSTFMRLLPAPGQPTEGLQHFELAVRVSGGGTGIYQQTEGRFRIVRGELRQVFEFTSSRRDCNLQTRGSKAWSCAMERREFYPQQLASGPGAVLLTMTGALPAKSQPPMLWTQPAFEVRYLPRATCAVYLWDQEKFAYVPARYVANPCGPPSSP